jgi:flagellar biogenesis protein FliO
MRKIIYLSTATLLSFIVQTAQAQNDLLFKKDTVQNIHWLPYLLAITALLVVLFFLAKKSKLMAPQNAQGKIIERIPVHSKMQVYILDYQGQRILIAENQNALAIHSLPEVKPSL